jgi:hypothetical protein
MAGTIQADFLQPQSGAGLTILTPSGNTLASITSAGIFSNTGTQLISSNGSIGPNSVITFDQYQNMGVNASLNAWSSTGGTAGYKAIQLNNSSIYGPQVGLNTLISGNAYYDGAAWRYISSGYSATYQQSPSSFHTFYSTPTGNAGSVITQTSVLQVGKDNSLALQGAGCYAGTGVSFPATQQAVTDPNTLDDYEEGGWTPTFGGNTTAGTATYAIQSARYTKIGRVVIAHFDVQTTSGLTGSVGVLQVKGLPFPAYNNGAGTLEIGSCSCGYFAGYTGGAYTLSGYIDSGASAINITYGNNGTATAYGDCTKIANGTRIQGTITYITST